MARKNIANRADIQPDALRQRRDLYALSIGLSLFNLAGGKIAANTAFGSLLPLSLERPWLLLAAAWLGFFYFWFRFWLVTDAQPFKSFRADAEWQAGNCRSIRRIAATFAFDDTRYGNQKNNILSPYGPIPKLAFERWKPILNLNSITLKGYKQGENQPITNVGPEKCKIAGADVRAFWQAYLMGYVRAVVRERAFTDYTLPHLLAIATVVIGLGRLVAQESLVFHHAPHVAIAQSAPHASVAPLTKPKHSQHE